MWVVHGLSLEVHLRVGCRSVIEDLGTTYMDETF